MNEFDQASKGNLAAILRQCLASWMRDEVEDMLPAVVVSYDSAMNRAVVRPLVMMGVKRDTGGLLKVSRPTQANVPVFRLGAGGFFIRAPIKPGDLGWIKANDRDISLVMQRQGGEDFPNTERTHDFNDSMFFPDTMFGGTLAPENENAMVIQSSDGTVCLSIHEDRIGIKAPTVEFDTENIDFVGTGAMNFTGNVIINGIPFDTHKHTDVETGGGTSGGPVA